VQAFIRGFIYPFARFIIYQSPGKYKHVFSAPAHGLPKFGFSQAGWRAFM
ncbi:MAG: hypothetical protein AVDCRST_MAG95-3884, partial [uncultured Adhaeribacter sp.]